jgi:uncharacterized membrane protein
MNQFRQISINLVWFLNILLLFLLAFEDKVSLPAFLQVAGRMHPLLLHFPIALIFISLFLDWFFVRKQPDNVALSEASTMLFTLSALLAALTALFGFFLYKEGGYQGAEINWHKWTGTLVSLMSGLLIWLRQQPSSVLYYSSLLVCASTLTITGHLGAEITHGEGFLTEPLRKQFATQAIVIENPDSALVYRDVIQPILNEKCSSCHNTNKAKGELVVTDYESVVKGGESKDVLVVGNAPKSLLYKYALLPMEDSLHMPPKGKQQLDADEIMLIGWWINSGAKVNDQYVNLPKVDSIHPLMASRFKPRTGLDLLNISFADQDELKELNTPYRTVQQLSATKPYVAVFLGSRNNFTPQDVSELKEIREQIVSIDLGNTNVKDSDLKLLSDFPHLQKLHLQNNTIGDEGIRHLTNLPYLESLNLSGTHITAQALEMLSGLKQLKKLFLYNTNIDEKQLAAIRKVKSTLELYNTRLNLSDTLYDAQLTAPQCKIDSAFFHQQATVEIKLSRGKVQYFYTLDGSEPSPASAVYKGPFQVQRTGYLKLMAAMNGWKNSEVSTYPLLKLGIRPQQAILETKPDPKFQAKFDSTLLDGKWGSLDINDKEYLGFLGKDMLVSFALSSPKTLSQLSISYLEDIDKAVFPPITIEVWGGSSKTSLKKLTELKSNYPKEKRPSSKGLLLASFEEQPLAYVRLIAKNSVSLPAWHPLQKKSKAWIFIDEVAME